MRLGGGAERAGVVRRVSTWARSLGWGGGDFEVEGDDEAVAGTVGKIQATAWGPRRSLSDGDSVREGWHGFKTSVRAFEFQKIGWA